MSSSVRFMLADIDRLLLVFDAYSSATRRRETAVSRQFLGRGSRISELRAGGDVGSRQASKIVAAFSANWPAGAVWPAGVPRPGAPAAAGPNSDPASRDPSTEPASCSP